MIVAQKLKIICGATGLAALFSASSAYALDAGKCYSAEQVRAETWDAVGDAKQYTLVMGDRTIPTRPKNYFTSTRDGSRGYNIEKSEDGRMCIRAKYTDVRVNTNAGRPPWLHLPVGSPNDKYFTLQEKEDDARIVVTSRTIVNVNGKERRGPDLLIAKMDRLVDGFNGGVALSNDATGYGQPIVTMMAVSVNPDLALFPGGGAK